MLDYLDDNLFDFTEKSPHTFFDPELFDFNVDMSKIRKSHFDEELSNFSSFSEIQELPHLREFKVLKVKLTGKQFRKKQKKKRRN
jgi:hypothetical protein